GQIECGFKEFDHDKLRPHLNAHEWASVALIYNGKGYRANQYDVKLAQAYAKWKRRLPMILTADGKPARAAPPEQSLKPPDVYQIQVRLRELGYAEVGEPGGGWDTRLTAAWSAFQADHGFKVDGHYNADQAEVLFDRTTQPREVSLPRETQTVDD